jgi:hypothetical protein
MMRVRCLPAVRWAGDVARFPNPGNDVVTDVIPGIRAAA